MNKSLWQLVVTNFRVFFREPAIIFWAVMFPVIMAWVLGIAFSDKGETVRTVYVTGSDAPQILRGEKIFGEETGSPVRIKFVEASPAQAVRAIKKGIISLYIEVERDSMLFHFDPANSEARVTHLLLDKEISGANASTATVRPLEAKGTRYVDFLIPGLIALGIMNSCIWGIGWTLIETRMKKLLRRMVATPMRKSVFLSSHIVTRIILGGFETIVLLLFAELYFDNEITGSIAAFLALLLAGIFSFSGIAVLISSRTSKTEVANGLINLVTLPMMILSGIFFNYHNFPDWAIPVIQVLPLTILADSIRSVFIEAAGFADIIRPLVILLLTGLVSFVGGLRMFRWY